MISYNESYITATYSERMVADMTFKKINKNTVQCVIAVNEIDQMGYALQELYTNKEIASNFMRSVMEKGEEAGYQLNSHLQEVQVMMLSERQLILSFTEIHPENQINQMIENALEAYEAVEIIGKERLTEILNMSGKEKLFAFQDIMAQFKNEAATFTQSAKEEQELEKENMLVKDMKKYMFQFPDLTHLEELCKSVTLKAPSHLYKDNKQYYLYMDFTGMDQEKIDSFMIRALDYEAKIEKNQLVQAFIEEHANQMIEKEAIEVLKRL